MEVQRRGVLGRACLLDVCGEDDRVTLLHPKASVPALPEAKEVMKLVRPTEKHQGRVLLGYLDAKGARDRPSCSEEEAQRIKQGAHSYWRREAAACRDRQREADIVVETLYKHQASD